MNTNRRNLLLSLAAASTAAATAGTTDAQENAAENPELLRLADELPRFEEAYLTAFTERRVAYRQSMKEWPDAPEEILSWHYPGDIERDVAGAAHNYCPCKHGVQMKVATVDGLEDRIRRHEREVARKSKLRSQRGLAREQELLAEAQAVLPFAQQYWADCERIKVKFSYPEKADAKTAAQKPCSTMSMPS